MEPAPVASLCEQAIKEFLEDVDGMCVRRRFDAKMKELEKKLLDRDLAELNSTLLKPLRLAQQEPKVKLRKQFPELYFENDEKAYVKEHRLEQPDIEVEKYSPFVPPQENFGDRQANSKLLKQQPMYTLNEFTSNLSSLVNTGKQSKFHGEAKATFPTIVLEGKEQHPLTNFPNATESTLREKVGQLGGLTNSLNRVGMESVMERNRKTYDQHYDTYGQFMAKTLHTSNTNNFVLEPPLVEVKQEIKNPFVRVPKKYDQQ